MPLNSCSVPGRKPGTSSNVRIGILNASQKRTNRAAFGRRVDIQATREHGGLIRHNPDRSSVHARESDYDVLRKMLLHFEEAAVVDDPVNDVTDVVGRLRKRWNDGIEFQDLPRSIGSSQDDAWNSVAIVLGKIREQFTDVAQALRIICR